ncbi:dihydrokaempferol 4-reductase [Cutaneotrichosporon oleaginosum]|uniref:Dihydrokaempferol 4-reductase n=1 Tax=Cutaneotrichosporon oleaginosum TaxID=879819 RepID=A0A0J0XWY9_9TREE|nr:dihydrokaempferol 4-reductase [Cutaneotrichosporon oleaginosum]KLT45563.1 dihydrokaempferol 4-reductase [Cutaneotrichosporon oleaginosum]TXT14484.1 hypothetical protein COLE_00677 [Cutaneotrichosporon oleaginosum]
MPAVQPPALILVTGASGFLGGHIVRALLAAGFRVRATARDDTKAAYLTSAFKGIEVAIVPDGAAPGAYDAAVVGVAGVVHAASPLDTQNTGHPNLVIEPAVKNVTELMSSVKDVKRVVQISSIAAVSTSFIKGGGVLSEADWNDEAPALCEKLGAAAPPFLKYVASKAVAERVFWDCFKEKRNFDGVALNCALVYGEPLGYAASQGRLEGSNGVLIPWMTAKHTDDELRAQALPGVSATDVADAVVRALTTEAAGGERFLVTSEAVYGNDYALAAAGLGKDLTPGNPGPAYRAGLETEATRFDTAKAEKILGIRFQGKDEMLAQSMRSIQDFLEHTKSRM